MKTVYTFLFILLSFITVRAQEPAATPTPGTKTSLIAAGNNVPDLSLTKVYPNPIKDRATIELKANQPGDVQLNLFNILGSMVKQWEPVYLTGGDQKIQLDLTSFPSGVYFLRLTKSNQIVTQILRKN